MILLPFLQFSTKRIRTGIGSCGLTVKKDSCQVLLFIQRKTFFKLKIHSCLWIIWAHQTQRPLSIMWTIMELPVEIFCRSAIILNWMLWATTSILSPPAISTLHSASSSQFHKNPPSTCLQMFKLSLSCFTITKHKRQMISVWDEVCCVVFESPG